MKNKTIILSCLAISMLVSGCAKKKENHFDFTKKDDVVVDFDGSDYVVNKADFDTSFETSLNELKADYDNKIGFATPYSFSANKVKESYFYLKTDEKESKKYEIDEVKFLFNSDDTRAYEEEKLTTRTLKNKEYSETENLSKKYYFEESGEGYYLKEGSSKKTNLFHSLNEEADSVVTALLFLGYDVETMIDKEKEPTIVFMHSENYYQIKSTIDNEEETITYNFTPGNAYVFTKFTRANDLTKTHTYHVVYNESKYTWDNIDKVTAQDEESYIYSGGIYNKETPEIPKL